MNQHFSNTFSHLTSTGKNTETIQADSYHLLSHYTQLEEGFDGSGNCLSKTKA